MVGGRGEPESHSIVRSDGTKLIYKDGRLSTCVGTIPNFFRECLIFATATPSLG